jgi:hypothetical protein
MIRKIIDNHNELVMLLQTEQFGEMLGIDHLEKIIVL